jgi:hypothetical protein
MTQTCTCIANSSKVAAEAARYRTSGTGWNAGIIRAIMKITGSRFPPKINNGNYAINLQALAAMLRTGNDRTMVAKALEGVGEDYVASVGYCAACQRPLPKPKPPQETEEKWRERKAREITSVLLRHPHISDASVVVWRDRAGEGIAVTSNTAKTAFRATLRLKDGSETELTPARPERRPNTELPLDFLEYQHRNSLWTRIKNRAFIKEPYDHDASCFSSQKERAAYVEEVRQRYAASRNIKPCFLEVRLLTTDDVIPSALDDFVRICSSRQRYYCEVITRVPGVDGTPGPIMDLENVSLRSLVETAGDRAVLERVRSRVIKLQKRFIQPLTDFEWRYDIDNRGKLRRKMSYRVGAGSRNTIYQQQLHQQVRQLTGGKRFFGDSQEGSGYLSLLETCDQQTGQLELKWGLTKDYCRLDSQSQPLPHNENNLYAVVRRYRSYAGTPEQVSEGREWHFQVRRVLAYCHGSYEAIQRLDTQLKQQTVQFRCDPAQRNGLTEFRQYHSKELCLQLFHAATLAVGMVCVEPPPVEVDWEQLSGPYRVTQEEWFQGLCGSELPVDQSAYAC